MRGQSCSQSLQETLRWRHTLNHPMPQRHNDPTQSNELRTRERAYQRHMRCRWFRSDLVGRTSLRWQRRKHLPSSSEQGKERHGDRPFPDESALVLRGCVARQCLWQRSFQISMDLRRRHPLARMPRQQLRGRIVRPCLHGVLPSDQERRGADPSHRW